MSVYAKLQKCRVELQNKNLKKTGENKFAGYKYYELADFLPTINELMNENKLCSVVSFNNEIATLTIIDTEDNTEAVFTSPMSSANLKGCHDVQNLGAVQTYIRRYLYTNAFEIVESDALDSTHGREDKKEIVTTISEAQAKMIYAVAKEKGIDTKPICEKYGYETKGKYLNNIKVSDYSKILAEVEGKTA